jgi:hypothetical protein
VLSPACMSRGSALLTFALLIYHVPIADNGRYGSMRDLLDDHEIVLFVCNVLAQISPREESG